MIDRPISASRISEPSARALQLPKNHLVEAEGDHCQAFVSLLKILAAALDASCRLCGLLIMQIGRRGWVVHGYPSSLKSLGLDTDTCKAPATSSTTQDGKENKSALHKTRRTNARLGWPAYSHPVCQRVQRADWGDKRRQKRKGILPSPSSDYNQYLSSEIQTGSQSAGMVVAYLHHPCHTDEVRRGFGYGC